MVNIVKLLNRLVEFLLKFYGLRSHTVEIEPGTVIHFWAPTPVIENQKKYGQTKPATDKLLKFSKPALLLLHGFGATGVLTWLFQVAAFSKNYAVFVPDLLFFGGSTTDSTDRSPSFQAKCFAKGLKLLGVKSCAVVGCSYGGIVGSKMALLYPKLVKCLVLSNSNFAITESHTKEAFERVGIRSWSELLLPDTVEGLKKLLRVIVYKRLWFPDLFYRHYLEVMFDGRKERVDLLNALVIKDDEFIIPKFSQKIYIMAGEQDKLFNLEIIQKTKAQLGEKATMHCIKKAGHFVHFERPFVYNRLLKKILKPSL